jgi:predicted porin
MSGQRHPESFDCEVNDSIFWIFGGTCVQKVLISAAAIVGIAAGNAQASDAISNDTSPKAAKHHHVTAKKVAAHHKDRVPAAAAAYQAQAVVDNGPPADLAAPLVPIARFFNSIPLPAKDGSLTYHGITVYGGLDMALGYQSHGAPLSSLYGRNYVPSPANSHSEFGLMPNARSNSNIGVKGVEEIMPGLLFVFNLQTTFQPQSFRLANGNGAQVRNNGLPTSSRESAGDSSRDGQIDNSQAYGGFSSPTFGTLTFGRQYSLGLDAVIAYDPMGGSTGFSLIGFQGMTPGGGNTEDARQGDMLKYRVNFGPFRAAATYKFDEFGNSNRNAYGAQVGGEYQGFSADVIYNVVKDSVTTASESLGQTLLSPNTLNGTVSDNYAVMAVASYKINRFKFYAGFENIRFENPENPLPLGSPAEGVGLNPFAGGVNNTAYTKNRIVNIFWGGVKYALRDNVDLIGAYYHYNQNSYAAAGANVGCSSRAAGTCSGTQDAGSVLVDYRFSKRLDVYAGAMYGIVHGGFASGYSPAAATKTSAGTTGAATNTIDPMVGLRFQF